MTSYTATYDPVLNGLEDLALPVEVDARLTAALDGEARDAIRAEIAEKVTAQIQCHGVTDTGEWLGGWSAEDIVTAALRRHLPVIDDSRADLIDDVEEWSGAAGQLWVRMTDGRKSWIDIRSPLADQCYAHPELGAKARARRRGRPPIGAKVVVRIPADLRARIAAHATGRVEAEVIRALLVEALDARDSG